MNSYFPEFFRYCREKGSGFGHGARKRDPIKAWQETMLFLEKYTNYKLTLPLEIALRVSNGEFDRNLYENIVSLLGVPEQSDEYWMRWRSSRDYDNALNCFIMENFKYSAGYEYDMSIRLHFSFHWKTLDQNLIEKNSDVFQHFFRDRGHGDFGVSIDNRLFIQPEFVVPIDNWDNFHRFVKNLTEDLPFIFSNKSFIAFYRKILKSGKKSFKSIGYYGEKS